ncbi:MAG: hypothetical protein LBP96_03890, partial [Bacteroidales bacterium]|nr:hypothetical protein [Bacteroidales bacterium]
MNRALLAGSIFIVVFAMWGVQVIIQQISNDEHNKVKMWASSVQRKAELIVYSQNFFEHVEEIERSRLELWAEAILRMQSARSA